MSKDTSAVDSAEETGEQDRETAAVATAADRADQVNPFGTLSWSQAAASPDGTAGKWTQTQTLNDEMQGLMDSDMAGVNTMNALQDSALERARVSMAEGPDWAQFGDAQALEFDPTELRARAEDAAYTRSTNRLDPRFQQEAQAMEVKLRNRGLRDGDEAFKSAMGNFGRTKNDAYEQARLGSVGEGRDESSLLFDQQTKSTDMANALRDKKIEEYIGKRGFDLEEAKKLDTTGMVDDIQSTYGGS